MLTEKQNIVVEKLKNTTEKLNRKDYYILQTIKKKCQYIINNNVQATQLYMILTTKKKR